jgi:hypothetical protein
VTEVDPAIVAARAEVDRTRARLIATARELQERFSPHTLVRDIWEGAKEKGAGLAEEAVDAVRSRPVVAGGVLAGLAMFLGRDPLMDLAAKVLKSKDKPTKLVKPAAKRSTRTAKPRKSSKPNATASSGKTAKSVKTESVE